MKRIIALLLLALTTTDCGSMSGSPGGRYEPPSGEVAYVDLPLTYVHGQYEWLRIRIYSLDENGCAIQGREIDTRLIDGPVAIAADKDLVLELDTGKYAFQCRLIFSTRFEPGTQYELAFNPGACIDIATVRRKDGEFLDIFRMQAQHPSRFCKTETMFPKTYPGDSSGYRYDRDYYGGYHYGDRDDSDDGDSDGSTPFRLPRAGSGDDK